MRETPDLSIAIVRDDDAWARHDGLDRLIEQAAMQAAAASGRMRRPSEAVIALSNDHDVAALNATFRNQDKPTNVLSFPAPPLPADVPQSSLGDIVLAYETIEREARRDHKTFTDHVQHLVVHGILHLLGFDHETDQEAEEMERLEVEILNCLGIADPYSEDRGAIRVLE